MATIFILPELASLSRIRIHRGVLMLEYKVGIKDEWIDDILKLHNKTDMGRAIELKEKFLKAYKNRYRIMTCWKEKELIGFGTVVSDGEMYSSIYDLVIDPTYQKKGIGREMIKRLLEGLEETCVLLTSTFGNEKFYECVGFRRHKTAYGKYPWESDYLV